MKNTQTSPCWKWRSAAWADNRGGAERMLCSQLTLRALLGHVEILWAGGFVLKGHAVLTRTASIAAIHQTLTPSTRSGAWSKATLQIFNQHDMLCAQHAVTRTINTDVCKHTRNVSQACAPNCNVEKHTHTHTRAGQPQVFVPSNKPCENIDCKLKSKRCKINKQVN